ncbi:MAG: sugar ABC transporter permease [Chloroflexi bacterium]|nr:sugar ABC transporter permease [Chloroflexota bacterium]
MKQSGPAPWFYLAPALLIMLFFVVYPTVNTVYLSFLDTEGEQSAAVTCQEDQPCWGIFENYRHALTDDTMLLAFKNNLLWIVLMVPGTTIFGLIIAVLVDRIKQEALAKAVIFMPMAISFVGAGVIWGYMYDFQSQGNQIGVLNGIVTALGFDPIPWTTTGPWINNVALIIVGVWMWTGFCMTILSAALKGVPEELLEAARTDGANEWTIFRRILVPIISPTIVVVLTTMTVNVLKIFDIVYVMGKGQPGTQVIATRMYIEQFSKFNSGLSSAIAVVLILAVLPIGYINVRRFREQEAMR